jgi:hypothetical protein
MKALYDSPPALECVALVPGGYIFAEYLEQHRRELFFSHRFQAIEWALRRGLKFSMEDNQPPELHALDFMPREQDVDDVSTWANGLNALNAGSHVGNDTSVPDSVVGGDV